MITDERIHGIAEQLAAVPGIRAVALGGSRARGTHHPDSDVDLGLSYDAEALDLPALRQAAREVVSSQVDLAYLQLCSASALMWCAHAWHAEAEVWVTNEKGVVPQVARLSLDTQDFAARATDALAHIGPDMSSDALTAAVRTVRELVTTTRESLA